VATAVSPASDAATEQQDDMLDLTAISTQLGVTE
jgi:hypothetical protein